MIINLETSMKLYLKVLFYELIIIIISIH